MAKGTILVVEDSPTEMRLVTTSLRQAGYTLTTATDGEEALEKADRDHPALIVLDVVLPKKNGYQVCRQLKTAPATKDIKILMLSSKSQDTDRYWGMKQGADAYLTKPFDEQQLLANVSQLM